MIKLSRPSKVSLLFLLIGFFGGCLGLLAVRFVSLKNTATHYHANFGVYINGARDEFKSFTFYEEVAACSGDDVNNPKTRAHMHQNIKDVVHVHDNAVTWGAFFANLGYTLGSGVLKTDSQVYENAEGKTLKFLLNGKELEDVYNKTINSEDVLLVSYGDDNGESLQKQYNTIARDAGLRNKQHDPATCSGSYDFTLKERVIKTLRIGQ